MWLTISGVTLVVFFLFGYLFFRGRQALGLITFWTVLLIVSAIVAPLIGEIGTPLEPLRYSGAVWMSRVSLAI
jgi:hypothetical protein